MDPDPVQPADPSSEDDIAESDEASDVAGDDHDDTEISDSAQLAMATSTQQMRDQMDAVANKHKLRGDAAFDSQEWQHAVHEYTSALKYAKGQQQEAEMLSRRSKALCNLCKHIRSIPARVSERRAMMGHDPTHLAQLALKDAEKATQIKPTCPELYTLQGTSLFLLERYSDAESAYLEGLALQPSHKPCLEALQDGLKQVQEVLAEQEREQQQLLAEVRRTGVAAAAAAGGGSSSSGRSAAVKTAGSSSPSRVYAEGPGDSDPTAAAAAAEGSTAKRQRRLTLTATPAERDDFECILCLKLLFEPVTTPCGHTFCKGCFARSMDHGNRCPMCRTVLHVSRELPVTITLQNIVSKAFPTEYAERAAEVTAAAGAAAAAAAAGGAAAERLNLPLFVMSTLLPGEKMALNIFEPRYRLMVRRCMEGNRRFGMATVGRTGPDGLDELAIESEITDCQLQPDGRYYLEIVGRRRIKIIQSWDLDGYRVASAEILKDTPSTPHNSNSSNNSNTSAAPATADTAGAAVTTGAGGGEDSTAAAAAGDAAAAAADVQALVSAVADACDALIDRLRSVLASRRVGAAQMRELFERLGDKPSLTEPEAISWWAARLLLLLAPSNAEGWLRREMMATTDTSQRLQMLQNKLEGRLEGAGAGSCTIM